MISPRYTALLGMFGIIWLCAIGGFLIVIDPFGVALSKFNMPGINALKPLRIGVDRQIKPFEVLLRQPRTVYLGTSRTQQSMDPRALDGTGFAPAYNSAVPAANPVENLALLKQFIAIDKNLRNVIVELFPYAYAGNFPEQPDKGWREAVSGAMPLLFSGGALRAAIQTVFYNTYSTAQPPSISRDGYWLRPDDWVPEHHFVIQNFAQFVLNSPIRTLLDPALATLKEMQESADKAGVRLIFFIGPSYPWDDYRLLKTDSWSFLEAFFRYASSLKEVYSFAQLNAITAEAPTRGMVHWNDPLHFSIAAGNNIQSALAGRGSGLPDNFIRRVTPTNVDQLLQLRKTDIEAWAASHSEARLFDMVKDLVSRNGSAEGQLDLANRILTVDGIRYPIASTGGAGSVESATPKGEGFHLGGWAVDGSRPISNIVMTSGEKIVKKWFASTPRVDVESNYGAASRPQGFWFAIDRNPPQPWRIFALTYDQRAFLLPSALPHLSQSALVP